MNDKQIDDLLKDVEIDKERVKKSVYTILKLYKLKPEDIIVYRKRLNPSQIFVAATEECNLNDAERILKEKYSDIFPAPVTVIEFRKRYVLFMGSNRSIVFILKGKMPDCIIVKISDVAKEPLVVSEATRTLQQILEEQRNPSFAAPSRKP